MGVFNLDRSAKAIIAGVVAGATAIAAANDDSHVTNSEKVLAIAAALTAMGAVWAFANPYVKAGLAGILAALGSFAIAVNDDMISTQEWVTIVVAGILAAGAVLKVSNTDTPPAPPTH